MARFFRMFAGLRGPQALLPLCCWIALQPSIAQADLGDVCGRLAREAERIQGIPPGLVQAVALAESGRWLSELRDSQPWPWTVTASTESFFLPSKEAALAKVEELQAAGRTNIDVGCMQVNLGYHGQAFASLEEALDPASNVAYAARFLKRLRQETRSWARATERYHTSDPERGRYYRSKVYRLWHDLRRPDGSRTAGLAPPPVVLAPGRLGGRQPFRLITPGREELARPAGQGEAQRPRPGGLSILRGFDSRQRP
ncbi:MAG: transglycosylase SLT domain-containing protein [Geminicoccales bacterium]